MEQFEKKEPNELGFSACDENCDIGEWSYPPALEKVYNYIVSANAELDRRQDEIERLKAELRGANDGIDPDDPFDGDIPWRHEIDNGGSEASDEH